MNQVTCDIMKFLGCTAEHAVKVQDQMVADGVDFSEVTKQGLRRAFRAAEKTVTMRLIKETIS